MEETVEALVSPRKERNESEAMMEGPNLEAEGNGANKAKVFEENEGKEMTEDAEEEEEEGKACQSVLEETAEAEEEVEDEEDASKLENSPRRSKRNLSSSPPKLADENSRDSVSSKGSSSGKVRRSKRHLKKQSSSGSARNDVKITRQTKQVKKITSKNENTYIVEKTVNEKITISQRDGANGSAVQTVVKNIMDEGKVRLSGNEE